MPSQARLSLSRSTWANQFNTLLYAQLWYNEGYFGKDILLFKDKKAMPEFKVEAPFQPTGDQPEAIDQLAEGIANGAKMQTLLGVTGSGKTYTVAKIIEQVQKPTLVLAPNKTLAAQLFSEYKEFFPNNAVEYFVSYYDYYQPEAYIPRTDTYVEKESMLNEEIEKLRLSTTRSLFERRDVLIVASVSCIYGLGSPEEYGEVVLTLKVGEEHRRNKYSRHLAGRAAGEQPWTLMDYLPEDYLLVVDESHVALPQVRGMFAGDRSRKQVLVDFGFRLPSALDNRPLTFPEFEKQINQALFVSATPGPYEYEHSQAVVEQVIRPTGLLDPEISVRPTKGQIDDLLAEIRKRVEKGQRVLVTTLTKKMAEDLADYMQELNIKVHYLHSEIETIERVEILRDLRLGVYDVVVGINLLREGLDLPEVSLVAILDADKEGFLRSQGSLIQMIGRAARHLEGRVIMYADRRTDSMDRAIRETERRRVLQTIFNERNNITPRGIKKDVKTLSERIKEMSGANVEAADGKAVAVAL